MNRFNKNLEALVQALKARDFSAIETAGSTFVNHVNAILEKTGALERYHLAQCKAGMSNIDIIQWIGTFQCTLNELSAFRDREGRDAKTADWKIMMKTLRDSEVSDLVNNIFTEEMMK